MIKVDDGRGQGGFPAICPNNLLQNPNFVLNPGVTDGWNAFCAGEVANWGGVDNTPHVIMQTQPSPQFGCDTDITDPTNTIACLRSGPADPLDPAFTESIFQTGLSFSQDPLVNYSVDLAVNLMNCGMLNSFTNMDVYLLNAGNIPQACINNTTGWVPPVLTSNKIVSRIVDWYNLQSVVQNIGLPNNTFDAIYIRSWKQVNSGEIDQTVLGIDNVTLTCRTTALDDLVINNTAGRTYEFGAVNISTVSTFTNYLWRITNLITNEIVFESNQTNPNFTFANSGQYNVCLDIVDNNGCCATRCEQLTVPCDDPVANFTISGECPNFTLIANNLDEGNTYSWVINGQQVGTNGVLPFSFTENDIFTIELFVTNECGDIAKSTITLEVECICEPPVRDFDMTLVCNNGVGNATFTVLNGQPGDSYTWNFGDGTANVTTSLVTTAHTYTSNGLFTVTLVVTNECGETQTITRTLNVTCVPPSPLCARYLENGGFFIDGGVIPVNFAQYVIQNNVPHTANWWFNNQIFVIRGTVVMDRNLVFVGCTFLFEGGASLELNNTSKSQNIVFSNSILQACDNVMWKGVKSINGNHRFVFGTTIQDAEYGIEMAPTSLGYISVNNAKLLDNIIGIYVANNSGNNIRNTLFSSTRSNNLGAYSGQGFYKSKPFAGVWYNNIGFATIGSTGTPGNNVFANLSNGILSYKSNLECVGNMFTNILPIPQYLDDEEPSDPKLTISNAIWCFGGFNHLIKNNTMSGTNEYKRILFKNVEGANILVQQNNFNPGPGTGIIFNTVTNSDITIKEHAESYYTNGKIACEASIIYKFNNANNKISISNNDFVNYKYVSMWVQNISDDFKKEIKYNKFLVPNIIPADRALLYLSSGRKLEVIDNIFEIYDPKVTSMQMINLNNIVVSGNEIKGLAVSNLKCGMRLFSNSSNNKFECNQIHNAEIGFDFVGFSNINIDFRSNLMHLNDIGLQVQGVFTAQRNKGNLWVGDGNGGKSLAKHLNGGSQAWEVNDNQCAPADYQSGQFRPSTVDPNTWFINNRNLIAPHCFGECNSNGNVSPITNGDIPMGEALELAGYLTDNVVDSPVQTWEWYSALHDLISSHPELNTTNDLIASAVSSMPYTVSLYKEMSDALNSILGLTEMESSALNEVRASMKQKQNALTALLTLLEGETTSSSEQIAQMDLLAQEITMLKMYENQWLDAIEQRVNDQLESLIAEIQELPETEIFHASTKQILDIKAKLHRYGSAAITGSNLALLQSISLQCYDEYGWPAAEAVSILNALGLDANIQYGPCENTENRKSTLVNSKSRLVNVYPNPGSDRITIDASGQVISKLAIRSVDGSLQMDLPYHANEADISTISQGVYMIDVWVDQKYLSTVKFIKIK